MPTTPQRDERHAPTPPSVSPAPIADLKRRRFLLALGAGSAATAAAAAQAVVTPAATQATEVATSDQKGYHVTEHIRDYYASTRL